MKYGCFLPPQPPYKDLSIEEAIRKIAGFGYKGADFTWLPVDLGQNGKKKIKETLESYGCEVSSVVAWFEKTVLLPFWHPNYQKEVLASLKEYSKITSDLGGNVMLVYPVLGIPDLGFPASIFPKWVRVGVTREKAWRSTVDGLREAAKVAADYNVIIGIEAGNRYETSFINTTEDAVKLAKETRCDNVRIIADTHHMNIEEVSLAASIKNVKGWLVHVHISDSNRRGPGMGHIDFPEIVRALKEINYDGFLSMQMEDYPDADTAVKSSIEYMKKIV